MNKNRFASFVMIALSAALLAGCSAPLTNWPGLSTDGSLAYLANGNLVYAVDLQNGVERWHYPDDPHGSLVFSATPVITPDGQLLVGSAGSRHALISLDPATGNENWSVPFEGAEDTWVAPPLALDNLIYAPNSDGALYILDLQGKLVERLQLGGALWSQPVTDGTHLFVASLDHEMHVIDPATRSVLASTDLGGAIPGGASLGADGVYAGSFASRVERIGPDGTHDSLTATEDWVWGAPTLDGETLYFADLGGNVYSFDLATRSQNWGEVKPNGPITPSPLVLGEQIVVVTESGSVHALNRGGQEVWRWPVDSEPDGKLYTAAVAAGDLILVAPFGGDNLLVALDGSGRAVWTFQRQ